MKNCRVFMASSIRSCVPRCLKGDNATTTNTSRLTRSRRCQSGASPNNAPAQGTVKAVLARSRETEVLYWQKATASPQATPQCMGNVSPRTRIRQSPPPERPPPTQPSNRRPTRLGQMMENSEPTKFRLARDLLGARVVQSQADAETYVHSSDNPRTAARLSSRIPEELLMPISPSTMWSPLIQKSPDFVDCVDFKRTSNPVFSVSAKVVFSGDLRASSIIQPEDDAPSSAEQTDGMISMTNRQRTIEHAGAARPDASLYDADQECVIGKQVVPLPGMKVFCLS